MELSKLKNIGTEMTKKLNSIGINSAEELQQTGSKEVFHRLKASYPEVCLVHLYAIQGAIDDLDFNMLSQDTKKELKTFYEGLK